MPRGRHRQSPPLHRLLFPSTIAVAALACAGGSWLVGGAVLDTEVLVLRGLASGAGLAAVVGAVQLRIWDRRAGKRIGALRAARARDEWRTEERVAELETDFEEEREQRGALENKLRAQQAELTRLRNEHAALLRRYATAQTERARALESGRRLAIEAAEPSRALSAFATDYRRPSGAPSALTYVQANEALDRLGANAVRRRQGSEERLRPEEQSRREPDDRRAGADVQSAGTDAQRARPDAQRAPEEPKQGLREQQGVQQQGLGEQQGGQQQGRRERPERLEQAATDAANGALRPASGTRVTEQHPHAEAVAAAAPYGPARDTGGGSGDEGGFDFFSASRPPRGGQGTGGASDDSGASVAADASRTSGTSAPSAASAASRASGGSRGSEGSGASGSTDSMAGAPSAGVADASPTATASSAAGPAPGPAADTAKPEAGNQHSAPYRAPADDEVIEPGPHSGGDQGRLETRTMDVTELRGVMS